MAVDQTYVLDRIEVDADDHWLWQPSKNNYGYGNANDEGPIGAHILAYKLWKGDYPKKWRIDHRIDCPKHCVNPAHLTAVPHSVNMKLVWRRRFGQMNRRDLRTARLLHTIVTERLSDTG